MCQLSNQGCIRIHYGMAMFDMARFVQKKKLPCTMWGDGLRSITSTGTFVRPRQPLLAAYYRARRAAAAVLWLPHAGSSLFI